MGNAELSCDADELAAATGYEVQVVEGGPQVPVIIKQVALPDGVFAIPTSDMLFLADAQYPLSALDMFWVELGVLRADGSMPANAEVVEEHVGRTWRRFSWHRNGIWSPARNGLLDHFEFALERLKMEGQR